MKWRVIKDFPNYSISDTGIVKRNAYTRIDSMGRKTNIKKMILNQYADRYGYYRVGLSNNNKTKLCLVHRLVAEAFLDNKDNLPCVNHKNENTKDNRLENLEWCSVAYNNNYGTRQKRVSITQGKPIIGYTDTISMLFSSSKQAGKMLGVASSNISECANGKYKQAYGFNWRWA